MSVVYIGIGTNLGDRIFNINRAVKLLWRELSILKASSIYETEPEGYLDQPDFLNCVICVNTDLTPGAMLKVLKRIENDIGRTDNFRNAPRIIDLDILLFREYVIEEQGLQIPHKRLHERAFVLVPLAEIASDIVHPVLQKDIRQILDGLINKSKVIKYGTLDIQLPRGENVFNIG